MIRSLKLQKRASENGFDWKNPNDTFKKIEEEKQELEEEKEELEEEAEALEEEKEELEEKVEELEEEAEKAKCSLRKGLAAYDWSHRKQHYE